MPYFPPRGPIGTGDLADDSVTSPKILDGEIVNADISAGAAIDLSKLATDPLDRTNHTGTQTAATISDFTSAVQTAATGTIVGGDITGTVGNAQLGAGVVTNAEISATANIALSKLATDPLARANHTGTQTLSTISDAGTAAAYDVPAIGDAATGEVVKGDDTRLTDARTPIAHTHVQADIIDLSAVEVGDAAGGDLSGTYPNPSVVNDSHSHTLSTITDAGTSAAYDVPAIGDAAVGEVVKGDDTRLTDARTPIVHTHLKAQITDLNAIEVGTAAGGDLSGTYPNPSVINDSHDHTLSTVTDAGTAAGYDVPVFGDAAAGEVVLGSDSRLASANGPAGGDLSGSYPNPSVVDDSHNHTLSTVTDAGTAAGYDVPTVGDAAIGEVVKGDDTRLTNARTPVAHTHVQADITDLSAIEVGDAAGGDLSGTYPNPSVVNDSHTHTLSTITDAGTAAAANTADLLSRANHTGTQTSATISDFTTAVQGVGDPRYVNVAGDTMTGDLTLASNTDINFDNTASGLQWSDVRISRNGPNTVTLDSGSKIQQPTAPSAGNDLVNYTWATGQLATKANVSHTHLKADITDLSAIEIGTAAGGDLSGTYPNPSVVDDSHNHTTSTITNFTTAVQAISVGGDATGTVGAIAVTDDSHNHTSSTISDFTTAVQGVGDPRYVNVTGDTMTGNLVFGANTDASFNDTNSGLVWSDVTLRRSAANVIQLGAGDFLRIQQDPVNDNDVVRKIYADTRYPIVTSATATATATTTSGTAAVISGMTITPGAGNYLVIFTSSGSITSGTNTGSVSAYVNGVQTPSSVRTIGGASGFTSNFRAGISIATTATVAAGQAIDVRFSTSGGTFSVYGRSLQLIRII